MTGLQIYESSVVPFFFLKIQKETISDLHGMQETLRMLIVALYGKVVMISAETRIMEAQVLLIKMSLTLTAMI